MGGYSSSEGGGGGGGREEFDILLPMFVSARNSLCYNNVYMYI